MRASDSGGMRKSKPAGPTWKMNAAGTRQVKYNAAGNPVGYRNMKTGPAGNQYPGPMHRTSPVRATGRRSGGVGRRK